MRHFRAVVLPRKEHHCMQIELDDELFMKLVEREIHQRATPEEITYLHSNIEVARRWKGCITTIRENIQSTMMQLNTELLLRKQESIEKQSKDITNAYFKFEGETKQRKIILNRLLRRVRESGARATETIRTFSEKERDDLKKTLSILDCAREMSSLIYDAQTIADQYREYHQAFREIDRILERALQAYRNHKNKEEELLEQQTL